MNAGAYYVWSRGDLSGEPDGWPWGAHRAMAVVPSVMGRHDPVRMELGARADDAGELESRAVGEGTREVAHLIRARARGGRF